MRRSSASLSNHLSLANSGLGQPVGLHNTMMNHTTQLRTLPEISDEGIESINAAQAALESMKPIVKEVGQIEDPAKLATAIRLFNKAQAKVSELRGEMNEAVTVIDARNTQANRKEGAARKMITEAKKERQALLAHGHETPALTA